jgi:hypothetical protein
MLGHIPMFYNNTIPQLHKILEIEFHLKDNDLRGGGTGVIHVA